MKKIWTWRRKTRKSLLFTLTYDVIIVVNTQLRGCRYGIFRRHWFGNGRVSALLALCHCLRCQLRASGMFVCGLRISQVCEQGGFTPQGEPTNRCYVIQRVYSLFTAPPYSSGTTDADTHPGSSRTTFCHMIQLFWDYFHTPDQRYGHTELQPFLDYLKLGSLTCHDFIIA